MKTVVLFGAGQVGAMVSRLLGPGYAVSCFVDNDSEKWGSSLAGIPVLSPKEGLACDPDCFCLCALDEERSGHYFICFRIPPLPDKLVFVASLQWTVDSGKWTVVVSPLGII